MKAKTINFERGIDPKDSMNIGLWKPFKDVFCSLEDFKENGGVLTEDRIIYNSNGAQVGFWLGYDENQNVDLMQNSSFKSVPVGFGYGVKIKAKVMYK